MAELPHEPHSRLRSESVRHVWHRVQAVCFDVDSTVIPHEGLDLVAELCGRPVSALTQQAMAGSIPFEKALEQRLDHIRPTRADIDRCIQTYFAPPALVAGVHELTQLLLARGVLVFLVSGGFELMVHHVADALGLPRSHVFANRLIFSDGDAEGRYLGYDPEAFTSRSGGKAAAVAHIKHHYRCDVVAMIGDGMTDAEARPPADIFIGFGGVVVRESVRAKSDEFIESFEPLLAEERLIRAPAT